VALATAGQVDEAVKVAESGALLQPAISPARMDLALLYERNGRFDDAISTYEAMLTRNLRRLWRCK